MIDSDEIVPSDVRKSAVTSHAIGVPELTSLLGELGPHAALADYERAVVDDNVLALKSDGGRDWRFQTLRRLYLLRQDSLLFRALGDLWALDAEGQPLLAGLCALATDSVFRSTADLVAAAGPGDELRTDDFMNAVELAFPDAYAESTLTKTAGNAFVSWEQTGHLGPSEGRARPRIRAVCTATTVAYALLIGHLDGHRGAALFSTVWARALDRPTTHLHDLAFRASQQGMVEFRSAGGVIEVGFRELLRPMEETA